VTLGRRAPPRQRERRAWPRWHPRPPVPGPSPDRWVHAGPVAPRCGLCSRSAWTDGWRVAGELPAFW